MRCAEIIALLKFLWSVSIVSVQTPCPAGSAITIDHYQGRSQTAVALKWECGIFTQSELTVSQSHGSLKPVQGMLLASTSSSLEMPFWHIGKIRRRSLRSVPRRQKQVRMLGADKSE